MATEVKKLNLSAEDKETFLITTKIVRCLVVIGTNPYEVLPERQAKIATIISSIDNEYDTLHSYSRPAVEEGAVYCICRSRDTSRFMICCDKCNEWYHGDCIGVTESQAADISQYFCDLCRSLDPTLKIRYEKKKEKHTKNYDRRSNARKSSRRCGECIACYRTEDCGRCDFCKDMRKFGGPNKIRQKCRQRQCLNFGLIIGRIKVKHHKRRSSCDSENYFSEELDFDQEEVLKEIQDGHYEPPKKRSKAHKTNTNKKSKAKSESNWASQRRSRRDDRKDSGKHSNKIKEEVGPQQCYGPGCRFVARTGSKYCSDDCGIKLATNRIFEILPQRIQQWNSSPCVAEEKNKQTLEVIRRQQTEARVKLQELDARLKDIEELIERAKKTPVAADQDTVDTEEESELNVYCVTCGHEIMTKVALRHFEKCFNKYESQSSFGSVFKTRIEGNNMFCDFYSPQQRTYCKRLRVLCPEHSKEPKIPDDEVCGCPLMNKNLKPTEEFCRLLKKKCHRHYCWEKLRRAEVDMERVREWLRLDDLFEQERNIRTAMANRAGVLGLMLHSSVDHSTLMAVQSTPPTGVS